MLCSNVFVPIGHAYTVKEHRVMTFSNTTRTKTISKRMGKCIRRFKLDSLCVPHPRTHLERLPPERREDPVGPVVGGNVKATEHLASSDGLAKKIQQVSFFKKKFKKSYLREKRCNISQSLTLPCQLAHTVQGQAKGATSFNISSAFRGQGFSPFCWVPGGRNDNIVLENLGIEPHLPVRQSGDCEPLHEHLDALGLASAAWAKDHDAVADLGNN